MYSRVNKCNRFTGCHVILRTSARPLKQRGKYRKALHPEPKRERDYFVSNLFDVTLAINKILDKFIVLQRVIAVIWCWAARKSRILHGHGVHKSRQLLEFLVALGPRLRPNINDSWPQYRLKGESNGGITRVVHYVYIYGGRTDVRQIISQTELSRGSGLVLQPHTAVVGVDACFL